MSMMLASARVGINAGARRNMVLSSRNALRSVILSRGVKTESLPPSSATEILNKQRLNRPSSPHFTIYEPQITWVGSIAHRVTGSGLSVLLYGFTISYLFAPEFLSSAHVIEMVSALPLAVKLTAKTILAGPFTYHCLNGLRHLAWDLGYFMTVKGAYRSGYAVLGATVVSTGALVAMSM